MQDSASIKNHGRSTARSIENGRTHPTQTSRMHSIIPEHSMDHFFPDKTDSPFSAPKSAPPSMHTASVYDTTPVQRHRLPSISNSISNDTVNLDKEYAKISTRESHATHLCSFLYLEISNAKQPAEAHVVANHPASGMEDYSSESKTMPEMQGWLHKQSERYRTWNKRWFALRGSNLFYYKAQDSHIKGIIHLQGYRIIYDGNMYTGKYAFKLHHEHERTFFLYTDTEAMMRSWTKAFIKATIVRNVSVPVKSSSTVLTISLNDAKRMNPRPPSMLFYAKQKNPHTLTHRPVSEISEEVTQPIMRMSVSEDAAMYRSHDKDAYPKDYLADTAWGFENTTESPTKDSGFISAHHTHGIHAHESFYEEDEEDLIDPLHKSGVTLYVPHFSKPLPSPPREHDWFHWRSYQWVHWINTHSPQKIKVLSDLQKGESLIFLLEGLSGKTVKRSWSKQNESVAQALDKIGSALRFMEKETIVADGQYNVEDIHGASDIKMIEMLGLVRLWYETKILKERSIADDTTLGRH
ncbi:hypothetical protein BDF14DRAFT_1750780 [Spinellus fusiger]|nr:hypothetical protein BDF14DRAFT_1750780 [Spinellus fusiger]